ncbi:MAG: hypothetical protein HYY17_06535 [Planctomycetes bacterium]|nr:hypothetical protein [Planctomycetota bacterium]
MNARRWKIAGLVAAAAAVALGPFLVVWRLRSSGPELDSPDGQMRATVLPGPRGSKLGRLVVVRKSTGGKIAETVCALPDGERGRIVWIEDSSVVALMTEKRAVLGLIRVKTSANGLTGEEIVEKLRNAAK